MSIATPRSLQVSGPEYYGTFDGSVGACEIAFAESQIHDGETFTLPVYASDKETADLSEVVWTVRLYEVFDDPSPWCDLGPYDASITVDFTGKTIEISQDPSIADVTCTVQAWAFRQCETATDKTSWGEIKKEFR